MGLGAGHTHEKRGGRIHGHRRDLHSHGLNRAPGPDREPAPEFILHYCLRLLLLVAVTLTLAVPCTEPTVAMIGLV